MEEFLAKRRAHVATAPAGLTAARHLSAMTDEVVRELCRAASSRLDGRWAIAALGGWGSGALLPASDLDILVLSDLSAERLKPFVEAVLYPLWDAGLKVGHQVRSPKQQLKAMREDLKTRTAALTARPIAGDTVWAASALTSCVAQTARRKGPVLADIRTRPRPGSPYQLEPNLKEGAGGRRDFDELTWSAAILAGVPQPDPASLVDVGVLSAAEFDELMRAAEAVAAARWALHRDGYGDLMSLDSLESLGDTDPEIVQRALGITSLTLARARARLAGDRPVDAPCTSDEFLSMLAQGTAVLDVLELLAQAGRIDGALPGFSALMSTRRPGLGHELTVGAHCLKSAAVCTMPSDDGTLTASLHQLTDRRIVRVACLAHDIAKAEGGAEHAERGSEPARLAARAFGLDSLAAGDVADLVRLHLVLIETAMREDLDNEDAILRCAARVARRELLAPLHLLTAADSTATGSATWTPWTAALVGALVSRVDAALSPDVDGAGLAQRGESVRRATLSSLGDSANTDQASFVSHAPLRYLASREPAEVARDARLVAELTASAAAEGALIAVSAGPVDGTHALTVVALDRPQLLSRLAGAIALSGLDILTVDAYGAAEGIALDSFIVTSATRRPPSTDTFARLERFVRAALRDRLELATRLSERRKHYPAASDVSTSVETFPSGWDTTVRVTAPDRPGLLHDIARAVSLTGVDIRWAKAQTIDGVARDTFHISGPDGGPVDDPGVLGHLAMRIRGAI